MVSKMSTTITTDDIVPSILLDSEVPSSKIEITYEGNKTVDLGTELAPHEVKTAPKVKWDCDPQKYYTLYMFDPDAPTRNYAFSADVNHWLVVNIKGCDLSTGQVMAEYRGSGPPKGTGFHRYIFLVFEHDNCIDFGNNQMNLWQRVRFSTKKFREKHHFEKVFAWNYFKSQWIQDPTRQDRGCLLM